MSPLVGITKEKLKFTLGCGIDNLCVVELTATVVDTVAYDVLLGMEFMRAAKGAYDSYTEMFHYRWEDESGNLHSTSLPRATQQHGEWWSTHTSPISSALKQRCKMFKGVSRTSS